MTNYDNSVSYSSGKKVSEQSLNRAEKLYNNFREYVDKEVDESKDSGLDIFIYDYAQKLNSE